MTEDLHKCVFTSGGHFELGGMLMREVKMECIMCLAWPDEKSFLILCTSLTETDVSLAYSDCNIPCELYHLNAVKWVKTNLRKLNWTCWNEQYTGPMVQQHTECGRCCVKLYYYTVCSTIILCYTLCVKRQSSFCSISATFWTRINFSESLQYRRLSNLQFGIKGFFFFFLPGNINPPRQFWKSQSL